jgi:hypothetical protein
VVPPLLHLPAAVEVAVLPLLHLPAAVVVLPLLLHPRMGEAAEAVPPFLHPPATAVVVSAVMAGAVLPLRHSRVAEAVVPLLHPPVVAVMVETVALWAAPPSELPIRSLLRLREVPRKRLSRWGVQRSPLRKPRPRPRRPSGLPPSR